MTYLKLWDGTNEFECKNVSKFDISFFSTKNQYTGENGNTIIYPVKSHKTKIAFAVEVQGDFTETDNEGNITQTKNLSKFMKIISQPEFGCDFRHPEYDWIPNGDGHKSDNEIINLKVHITSDITIVKIISENGDKGGLYVISATIEEV